MTLIIAHRGASREMPENTLVAFQRAIDLRADGIELDVHLTKDDVVVIHHDDCLKNGMSIREHLFADLKSAFLALPTLRDVAQLMFNSTGLMVELKGDEPSLAKAVKEQLQGLNCPFLVLGSFSPRLMQALQQNWPLSQLVGIAETEEELASHIAMKPRYLAIDANMATAQRVGGLRAQGFEVWVWTVDNVKQAQTLVTIGVQGIITNDPLCMISI